MSEPFLGEVRIFGFNFAPRDWAFCNGQIIKISQNQALCSLLGSTYGGDGRTTFGLPDLRGRAPVHPGICETPWGSDQTLWGQKGGVETVVLSEATMPTHTHSFKVSKEEGNRVNLPGTALADASASGALPFADSNSLTALDGSMVSSCGSGQAHTNIQPSIVVNFCIATAGIYPQRN